MDTQAGCSDPLECSAPYEGLVRLMTSPPLDDADRSLLWTLGKAAALASVARIFSVQFQTARQLEHRIVRLRDRRGGLQDLLDAIGAHRGAGHEYEDERRHHRDQRERQEPNDPRRQEDISPAGLPPCQPGKAEAPMRGRPGDR